MEDAFEVSELSKPTGAPDEVVVRFTGSAAQVLEQLRDNMGLSRREEVVGKAVELLYGALGKEMVYRDGRGQIETVKVWKGR